MKPDYVNPENGYRYYTADQLDLLDNIAMLKEIGLSLEEIREFMEQRTRDCPVLMQEQLISIRQKIRRLQTIEKQLAWKVKTLRDFSSKSGSVTLVHHDKTEFLAGEAVRFPKRRKGTDEEDLMAQNIAIKQLMTKAKKEHYPYFYQQGAIIPHEEIRAGHCLRASHMFLPLEKITREPSALPSLRACTPTTILQAGIQTAQGPTVSCFQSFRAWGSPPYPAPMNTVSWTA